MMVLCQAQRVVVSGQTHNRVASTQCLTLQKGGHVICMTIEFRSDEWFIDRMESELRSVKDPSKVMKFSELDPEDVQEIVDALEYRESELMDLKMLFEEIQYPADDAPKVTATGKSSWGK